jgi:RNA polymerase sigma factor (sigma-70 family)
MARRQPLSQTDALLSALRQGSPEAFATIFRMYYSRVFAEAYRLLGSAPEAEDVTQEAFLRLYLRPLPEGREHNLLGWLLRVASNLGYNILRSQRRRQTREGQAEPDRPPMPDAASAATAADLTGRVRQVLTGMPERQVQLLLLRNAGLSYAELGQTLGIAAGSVGTLLARAEQVFRRRYGELEGMEDNVDSEPLS